MQEGVFPVCGIASASSRLGASLILVAYDADHAQEHGESKNWPALIGTDKQLILFLVFPAHRGAQSKAARI